MAAELDRSLIRRPGYELIVGLAVRLEGAKITCAFVQW